MNSSSPAKTASSSPTQADGRSKNPTKLDWNTNHGMMHYGLLYLYNTKHVGLERQEKMNSVAADFNAAFRDILDDCGVGDIKPGILDSQYRESHRSDGKKKAWMAVLALNQTPEQVAADAEAKTRIVRGIDALQQQDEPADIHDEDEVMADAEENVTAEEATKQDARVAASETNQPQVQDAQQQAPTTEAVAAATLDGNATPTPLITGNNPPQPGTTTIREALNALDYGQINDLFRAMFPGKENNILLLALSRTIDDEKAKEVQDAYNTLCRLWKPRFLMQEAFKHPDSPARFE